MRANTERDGRDERARPAVVILLFAGTFLLFARSIGFGFIPLDDPFYVTENPWVRSGPAPGGLAWAFTSYQGGNWHPLTWLSLMADAALSDGRPWAFHLTNVLCHAAAASVLFIALHRMTGRWKRSAVVAALFAAHPLHVESVAWISERKDVLSALFGFLALAAYAHWIQRPTGLRFATILGAHAASLAAKPMGVTLPIVLLLLDVWPLNRSGPAATGNSRELVRRRIAEKIPLFALSTAAAGMALVAQRSAGAIAELNGLPLAARIGNAVYACSAYLLSTIWPSKLAVFYPYPAGGIPLARVVLACAFLLAVSAIVLRHGARLPYLRMGWLWYLVTLLPVIGIVQVGMQAKADRYTYVPLVGVFLAAVWGVADLTNRVTDNVVAQVIRRRALAVLAAGAIAACGSLTWFQLALWENGVTLFAHTVAVTGPNSVARNCLGRALLESGRDAEAAVEFGEAIRITPEFSDARSNLAGTLVRLDRIDEAKAQYRETLRLNPEHVLANANLGRILLARSEYEAAARCLATAVAGRPGNADTRAALGSALLRLRRPGEAVLHLKEALRLDPARLDARVDLGFALAQSGDLAGAARETRTALRADPSNAAARSLLDSLTPVSEGPP